MVLVFFKNKRCYYAFIVNQVLKKTLFEWIHKQKNLKFYMVLNLIVLHQFHSPQKNSTKVSTHNLNFEVYI
jgi:hypothetical protein